MCTSWAYGKWIDLVADRDRTVLANKIVTRMPSFGSWSSAINEFQTPFGKVGYRQLQLLWAIRNDKVPEGATASAMANLFQIQPSVVTRVLAKLEAHAFIERTVDPDDGRQFNITVTPLGAELSVWVETLYNEEVLDQLALFSPEEVDRIADAVDLFAALGQGLVNARKALITGQTRKLDTGKAEAEE